MILILSSCSKGEEKLIIKNNTNEPIYFTIGAWNSSRFVKDYSFIRISPGDSVFPTFSKASGKGSSEYAINTYMDSVLKIYIIRDTFINEKKLNLFQYKVRQLDSLQWKLYIR